MKGYAVLTFLAVLIVLLTPFAAYPRTPSAVPPSGETPHETAPINDAVFKVKNTANGEILTMSEEDFLIGVVSCEMAPSSPTEALKAQTVAAYTYYCKQRAAAADGVFSNVPETLFTVGTADGLKQRLGDKYDELYGKMQEIVRAVKGQTLTYDGELITACYHAISAGVTDSAEDVWGGEYPYLQPVDSSGDLTVDGYQSEVKISYDAAVKALQSIHADFKPDQAPEKWFGTLITTDSGLVKTATICGKEFTGTKLRTALDLRSAVFTAAYADNTFTFTVKGYGHNVGMSQMGAKYMANQGAAYKEILAHYYPHTKLV